MHLMPYYAEVGSSCHYTPNFANNFNMLQIPFYTQKAK
jgi:hypothetical protein